jgi:hypothetical protein
VKDGINIYVVHGQANAVNPAQTGTKAAAHYRLQVEPGQSAIVRVRLTSQAPTADVPFGAAFDEIVAVRRREADTFYASVTPPRRARTKRG